MMGKKTCQTHRSHDHRQTRRRVALQKQEDVGEEHVELEQHQQEVEVVVAGAEVEEKVVKPGVAEDRRPRESSDTETLNCSSRAAIGK